MRAAIDTAPGTSSADIARRSEEKAVLGREPQLVMGVVAQTTCLHARIRFCLRAKGLRWADLAESIGLTRQAVLASVIRRYVQYSRVREIAAFIGVSPEELLDEEWTRSANDEIL